MKIRTRLALLFTLITVAIVLVFAGTIYYSAKQSRESEFYQRLEKEALTKANLFFKTDIPVATLQDIYRNNRKTINEVEVAIYATDNQLLYHDANDIDVVKESPKLIAKTLKNGSVGFYRIPWQILCVRYEFQGKNYIITAAAIDQHGFNKLENLRETIAFGVIISIFILYFSGRFFSKKALAPIKEMTDKAKVISATNLDLRITEYKEKDELAELAATINEMLSRLEKSFDAQKRFVSNISHEIRTPLAAIITELELSLNKEKNLDEYKKAISNALGDAHKLANLSNSLLDLAKASYDPSEIAFKPVRIDEILLDAQINVQKNQPNYKPNIQFTENFDDELQITCNGNEYLLRVAFINLFDNGCKFSSDHTCSVMVSFSDHWIVLKFIDHGIGITENDLKHLFTPFFRGENKKFADGNGIGLPLTQRIVSLHNGELLVHSEKEKGTTFEMRLPML